MVIDCDTCVVRGLACQDCVVTVLLGTPAVRDGTPTADGGAAGRSDGASDAAGFDGISGLELDADDHRAIDALADAGLVPRLRLVTTRRPPDDGPRRAAV